MIPIEAVRAAWSSDCPICGSWSICARCGEDVEDAVVSALESGTPWECRCGCTLPTPPAEWLAANGYEPIDADDE